MTAAAPVDESVVQQLVEEMKSVKVELQSVQVSPKATYIFWSLQKCSMLEHEPIGAHLKLNDKKNEMD